MTRLWLPDDEGLPRISGWQLLCIMLVSRISAEIAYPKRVESSAGEAMLALVAAELIRFVLALPVIIYSFRQGRSCRTENSCGSGNFYGSIWRRSKFFGWVSAIIAAALLVGAACRTVLYAAGFANRSLLVGMSAAVVTAIALAFAIYAACMGVEALARSGVLFLAGAAIVTAAIILADIPFMRITDVSSDSGEYSSLIADIIERLMQGGDYLVFAAMLPFVAKNRRSSASGESPAGGASPARGASSAGGCALCFALLSALICALLQGFCSLTLREQCGREEYPFIAAASLSDISLFKRLDGIGSAIWALCAVFRAGLMLLGAWSVVCEIIRSRKKSYGGD